MNLYQIKVQGIVLVEADNVMIANKVAKQSVRLTGDRVGWSRGNKGSGFNYRVEIEKMQLGNPKRIKP